MVVCRQDEGCNLNDNVTHLYFIDKRSDECQIEKVNECIAYGREQGRNEGCF